MNIFERLINSLDNWMQASTGHYYSFLVTTLLVMLIGFIIIYIYGKKIGSNDERTQLIRSRIGNDMLIALVILSVVFVSSINKSTEYLQQIYMLFLAFATIAGAISSSIRYNRSK